MRVMNKVKRKLPVLEVNIICVLLFSAGTLVIVRHPNWFG
jgi:hypothetical protein